MPKTISKRHAATLESYGFNVAKIARDRKRKRDTERKGKRAYR